MALFGKSESELKQIAGDLDKKQTDLSNREISLASAQSNLQHENELLGEANALLDSEREAFRDLVKKEQESIASDSADLERRRLELAKLEAEARTGFVERQREGFKEVIEKRLAELDSRQDQLNHADDELARKYRDLHSVEAEIAKRELAVTEREQKADAGFADKIRTLADDALRQHQANKAEAERLRTIADSLAEERQGLEAAKAQLLLREQSIIASEQKRDAGFTDERAAIALEQRDKRAQLESQLEVYLEERRSAMEQDIANLRNRHLKALEQEETSERERFKAEFEAERQELTKHWESVRKQLENEQTELEKQKGALRALQSEIEGRLSEVEANERVLERREQRSERIWQKRNEELTDGVASQIDEERGLMEAERQSLRDENSLLRESLRTQMGLIGAFDQLKQQLGDKDPAEIIRELNSKTDEFKRLREELATRPTDEMRQRYREMEEQAKRHQARVEELNSRIEADAELVSKARDLQRRNTELDADNKMLAQMADSLKGAANAAQAELKRLHAAYERPAEVEARYKEIELPYIKADKVRQPKKDETIDETTWLMGVGNACDNYGLHFHPRILKAFHTALKTAEWSPLTILAGVSGTGKSELPRLYSHFGGLIFEPLSVQPNWDSKESMLGFFNSIDNKFDAQPVLQFLAQSQKKWIERTNDEEGYPGLQDALCLILLDEMNLAHPELYFAEFLSKLELRRGMKGSDVPFLPVGVGAGMPEYQLPLGRNVLWAGTMNQDETTKSLSDKVLDRSIIIHFPRPTELKRRLKLVPLDEKNRGPLLHKGSWQAWLVQGSSFSEDDIKPYKQFVERMNEALSVAGRAIGHRVWQSVEYYMANYPDVRTAQKSGDRNTLGSALHVAFEDQLVQKIMPKLRGIDTRGTSLTDCLEKIRDQINVGIDGNPFHLEKDFNLACELGYGQFIWQSANYLTDTEPSTSTPTKDAPMQADPAHDSDPPDSLPPENPSRAKKRKSPSKAQIEEDLSSDNA
jgi:hypothetical protein